jgi:hypothetical protein
MSYRDARGAAMFYLGFNGAFIVCAALTAALVALFLGA